MIDFRKHSVGGYAIPIILIFIGGGLLVYFLATIYPVPQPMGVFWGAICLLIAGAFALPMVQERISKKAKMGFSVAFAIISVLLFYGIYASIGGEIDYLEQKDARTKKIVQSLTDIRSAQKAYRDINGVYTNNFDTLVQFVKEPKMNQIKKLGGELNDSIGGGKYEAYVDAGYILSLDDIDSVAQIMELDPTEFLIMIENDKSHFKVRDTTLISFYDLKFSPDYRREKELPLVNLDSLPYDPFSGEKFIVRVSSTEVARVKTPTIEVLEPQPFRRPGVPVKLDTLRFGSLTDAHTDGNWKKFE